MMTYPLRFEILSGFYILCILYEVTIGLYNYKYASYEIIKTKNITNLFNSPYFGKLHNVGADEPKGFGTS